MKNKPGLTKRMIAPHLPAKTHTHIHPDEFFAVTKGPAIDNTCFKNTGATFNNLPGDDECEGKLSQSLAAAQCLNNIFRFTCMPRIEVFLLTQLFR
ncbi:MAG: hypothetical protein V9F01_17410 [Chitinophagaceae bacterium]